LFFKFFGAKIFFFFHKGLLNFYIFAEKSFMRTIQLNDKVFEPYLSAEKIAETVRKMAYRVASDHQNCTPVFVVVLSGSFLFAADFVRLFPNDCEIDFIRLSSYQSTCSTGEVKELSGLRLDISNRHIVVLEDIVDTGLTLEKIISLLSVHNPASLKIASLLFKPDAYKSTHVIDYVGIEIPDKFVVGYGLDYDGLGRNLPDIYQIVKS